MAATKKVRRKSTFGVKVGDEASSRRVRRMAGLVYRLDSADLLERLTDPRSARGRRWKECLPLLRVALLGLACGCKGLKEVEKLSARLSKSVRKLLGVHKRVPDTTLGDFLCELDVKELEELVHVVGYDAWRRKALQRLAEFPFHALSLDGKYPSFKDPGDDPYLQHRHDKETGEYLSSVIRTITATLVTAPGRPILGATPVPGHTNEMGAFQQALGDSVRIYGRLFKVVMYDAGAASDDNARAVLAAGKQYFFQIADPRRQMYKDMEILLAGKPVLVRTEEQSGKRRVVRELSLCPVRPTRRNLNMWGHTRTILKVHSEKYVDGVRTGTLDRYFATSMDSVELTPDKWLRLVVLRWGVETSHQILDTAFAEDKRPWFTKNARGALVIMLMRRLVYTVLTLFKSRTQRSEDKQLAPWHELLEDIRDAAKTATEKHVAGLRPRPYKVPPALA
jgi:hypothetical protein